MSVSEACNIQRAVLDPILSILVSPLGGINGSAFQIRRLRPTML